MFSRFKEINFRQYGNMAEVNDAEGWKQNK